MGQSLARKLTLIARTKSQEDCYCSHHIEGNVRKINPQKKIVKKDDTVFSYDILIVAVGMNTHFFGHADWEKFPPGLKTIEDAVEIRSRVLSAFEKAERTEKAAERKTYLTFVVVGADPTGVELAGALAELARLTLREEFRQFSSNDVEIYLIEDVTRILPTFSGEISDSTSRVLNQLGVKVLTSCRVDRVDGKGVRLILATGDRELSSDTIIWAAGVKACALGNFLKSAAGAEQDSAGRLRITEYLTLPTHDDIYVIGDLANSTDRDGKTVPGVAPTAIQQGRYVAWRIIRQLQSKPSPPFRYFDKGAMAVVGRGRAVAESGRFRLFRCILVSGPGPSLAVIPQRLQSYPSYPSGFSIAYCCCAYVALCSRWRQAHRFGDYSKKKRSVARVRSTAAPRDKNPRSTPTGYAARARPVAAILDGQFAAVLSFTRPLAEFVSVRKYRNESR